jgi:hypothetical protein
MHSSPYVKAFEEEMEEWEGKLISMQDILDAWLIVIYYLLIIKQRNIQPYCFSVKLFGSTWPPFLALMISPDKCQLKVTGLHAWTLRGAESCPTQRAIHEF